MKLIRIFLCCSITTASLQLNASTNPVNPKIIKSISTIGCMAVGASIGYFIAEKIKKPHFFVNPSAQPTTFREKIKYFYHKNRNTLRTLLFTTAGAASGGLIGFYIPALFIKKPTAQDLLEENKKLCEQEIEQIHKRFNGLPLRNELNNEEIKLYDEINQELRKKQNILDFFIIHANPSHFDILQEMEKRLCDKVKIKYARKELEIKNQHKEEKKPTVDNKEKCPICLEIPTNPQRNYKCEHDICAECFANFNYQPGSEKCPVCRQPLK